ncbi:MAG: IS30 family transposase [Gammaproteobacteria bacterium]|nr:IS30 family transposase [Gammaproteobacteria bacterium]
MNYRQLTSGERYTISTLKRQGFTVSEIAYEIGRHRSTIYRELKRNSCNDGRYRVFKASSRTRGRRSQTRRNQQFSKDDFKIVNKYLRMKWSPDQISNTLCDEGILDISHETIYKHIWLDLYNGGNLYTHLRQSQKKRRKRYNAYDSRGMLAGKRHITQRPQVATSRKRIGDWEIDLVMGRSDKDCILTLVDRKSGFTKIYKLKNKTKKETNKKLLKLMSSLDTKIKTITADNGTEFHGYKEIEEKTGVKFYFCTPYHSWERGTNENTNGLIRQYLPKGESMASLTQRKCNKIAHELNTRPRKRHNYKTPLSIYEKG